MKKKLIIFDLDGTLLDTLGDLHASVNFALELQGLPPRSLEEVRSFVGNGIFNLICRSVPQGTSEEILNAVFEAFKARYAAHSMDLTRPYEGIGELLSRLKAAGCRLGVVTNKADFAAKPIIAHYFPGLFDSVVGEREGVRRKPAPDTVLEVMRSLSCTPEDSVYVGDSDVDLQTAENAGCRCIGVSWGFRGRAFLEEKGAELIADSAEELAAMLGV